MVCCVTLFSFPLSPSLIYQPEQTVLGDNCFQAHEAALREFLGQKDVDLVYARFTNSVYDRPYAILVDHKWQCVVVTIRGTLSLEDCLVDANADPVSPLILTLNP